MLDQRTALEPPRASPRCIIHCPPSFEPLQASRCPSNQRRVLDFHSNIFPHPHYSLASHHSKAVFTLFTVLSRPITAIVAGSPAPTLQPVTAHLKGLITSFGPLPRERTSSFRASRTRSWAGPETAEAGSKAEEGREVITFSEVRREGAELGNVGEENRSARGASRASKIKQPTIHGRF